jgi:NADH-quinone oxidoreductase subunit C
MGIENTPSNTSEFSGALKVLVERFPEEVRNPGLACGDASAEVVPEALAKVMEFLRSDPRTLFDVLVDITAVDYPGRKFRFEVVYHLLSFSLHHRIRIKVLVQSDKPAVPTLCGLWGSANWLEREVWDMFGVEFAGHPNLTRILLYPEFEGHPLRKDYPVRRRQPLVGPKN